MTYVNSHIERDYYIGEFMVNMELNSFDCRSRVRRAFKSLSESQLLRNELGYNPNYTEVLVVNGSDEIIYTLVDRYTVQDNYIRWVHVSLDSELTKPTVVHDFVEIKSFTHGSWNGWLVRPKGDECWRMKLYKAKLNLKSWYSKACSFISNLRK